ncbi:MAG: DUF3078 domain-containing protein [Bacteroidia bacterium]|nr:DUF3078 domain-containing protein [Bacteroidia bacterium]
MRKIFIVLLLVFAISAFAQDAVKRDTSYWKSKFSIGMGINQASFSQNWKSGGVNSMAISSVFSGKVEYNREKVSFLNDIQLQYGRLYNQNEAAYLPDYRKTQDRIFIDSKLGYNISSHWLVFASLNFQSQFDKGYKYDKDTANREVAVLTSRFFAPAYITESMGFEYKPVSYFSVRAGIGTLRQTIVNDKTLYLTEPKNYGVKPGETFRNELAFMLIMNFDKDVAKNMNLKVRYQGFANYEQIKAIDSRVDATLTARINKLFNVTLTGVALYDQDQDYKMQFSQAMSLGFLYNF